MTNLDSVFKSRDITLPTEVCTAKAMVFPVLIYGHESWTIKKAEHWRINSFKLWYWRRKTLESLLHCSELKPVDPKGNQPWIFIGRTDAETSSSTLATWCEEPTHWKRPWCWGISGAGGEEDDRGWDGWMASLTQWTWVWANSRKWWRTGKPAVLQSMGLQGVG